MFYVSEIQTTAPVVYKTPLQKSVYETLEWLQIPFERVDTDEAVTMEDLSLIHISVRISYSPRADRRSWRRMNARWLRSPRAATRFP